MTIREEIDRYIIEAFNNRFEKGSEGFIMLDKCARHFYNVGKNHDVLCADNITIKTNPIDYWYQKYLNSKLTWKDIDAILQIDIDYSNELAVGDKEIPTYQKQCEEILRRFLEYKTHKNA